MWEFLSNPAVYVPALALGGIFMWASKGFEEAFRGKNGRAAKWFAFGFCVLAGLMIAVGLRPVVAWVAGLGGLGSIPASIGTIVSVLLGWESVYMIVGLIRDLADKEPDGDARRAARWIPTFAPVGIQAIVTLVSNPRSHGFGLGVSVLTAAIVSAITMAYTFKIFGAVDLGKTGKRAWKWFAAGIAFLAGFVHIALITYLDGIAADFLPGAWMVGVRIVLGTLGAVLLIMAMIDILKDRIPDQWVRRAGVFGVPLATLFFSLALAAVNNNIHSTMQYLSLG